MVIQWKQSASGSLSIRTAPWGGRCCTWPSSSRRWLVVAIAYTGLDANEL